MRWCIHKVYKMTDSPEHVQQPIYSFAQIGAPQNVTVNQTGAGDEFVVSWYPPEFGQENLHVFVVRWWLEPGHYLQGSAETRNQYFIGKTITTFCLIEFWLFALFFFFSETFAREWTVSLPSVLCRQSRLSGRQQWVRLHRATISSSASHCNRLDHYHDTYADLCFDVHLCEEAMLWTLSWSRWKATSMKPHPTFQIELTKSSYVLISI